MQDFVWLTLGNVWGLLCMLCKICKWERLMRENDPTFDRENVSERSRSYKKMIRTIFTAHGLSFIGALMYMILAKAGCATWILLIFLVLSVLFLLYPPIVVWQLFVAERREKQWLIITNNKRKLTRKERREAEQKLKQISLFKRLDRLREEQ